MRIIVIVILLFTGTAFGQKMRKIDSLEKLLSQTISDTNRCVVLGFLCEEYMRIDKQKAFQYNCLSMELARKLGYKKGLAMSLYDKAILLKYQGKNDSAILLLKLAKEINEELKDTAYLLNNLSESGAIYLLNQDYQRALTCFLEAEKGYIQKRDKKNQARIYSQIGSLYKSQKQDDEALMYHQKSLKITQEINFKLGISVNLNNIGNIYEGKKNYDSAISYYSRALKLKELLKDKLGTARTLNNLGMVYLNKGDVKTAIEYHLKSLKINREDNNTKDLAINYANLGFDYLKTRDFVQAGKYARLCLDLAEPLRDFNLVSESYNILAEVASVRGNHAMALSYYRLHKQFYDSLINERNQKTIVEISTRYEVVKKEKEIAELNAGKKEQELRIETIKANRNLYLSLLIGVIFAVGFLILRIRNRKKLENHLQEINKAKSKFYANLSHEIRTPLSLMLGPVETLLKHAGSKDKVLLELIYRNANRVLTLDEQLLELTRLETRNQKLKLVEGDIVIVLKGIASAFQSLAERRKIQYLYEFDLNEPFAIFDADVVEKIINNLLTNAFKFTPDQGTVSITAGIVQPRDIPGKKIATGKKSSRYIHIEVKDSGIGIPEKYLGKIFDRFFQVSEGKNHSQNGNGIGLALTKELVDLNHGWITLVSKENQGSLFSVFLPIDKEAFTAEEIRNVSGYSTGKIAGEDQGIIENAPYLQEEEGTFHAENNEDNELKKILIVEDNSDMRRYLGITLSDHYEVISAVEGAEGFRMACTTHPDLIITDLMMPGIDGMEFCRKIKSEERTSHIPVIMLTALASTLDRIAGFETGADDYIGKPFSNPELLARIKNLISQRTKLRHLFGTEMKVQPSDVTVTSVDERFLQRLIKAIEDQIDNPEIDIEYLTKSVNMSRSQLHQKLKALTGLPATGFVKIIRLKRAASLMEQNFGNVSDISYAVGFTNLSYFSKCFREVYHESPSDYLNKVVKQ